MKGKTWFQDDRIRLVEKLLYSYGEYITIMEETEFGLTKAFNFNQNFSPSHRKYHASSSTEKAAFKELKLPDYFRIIKYKKEELPPLEQQILEFKYFRFYPDYLVWETLKISNNTYYKKRKQILSFFLEELRDFLKYIKFSKK